MSYLQKFKHKSKIQPTLCEIKVTELCNKLTNTTIINKKYKQQNQTPIKRSFSSFRKPQYKKYLPNRSFSFKQFQTDIEINIKDLQNTLKINKKKGIQILNQNNMEIERLLKKVSQTYKNQHNNNEYQQIVCKRVQVKLSKQHNKILNLIKQSSGLFQQFTIRTKNQQNQVEKNIHMQDQFFTSLMYKKSKEINNTFEYFHKVLSSQRQNSITFHQNIVKKIEAIAGDTFQRLQSEKKVRCNQQAHLTNLISKLCKKRGK